LDREVLEALKLSSLSQHVGLMSDEEKAAHASTMKSLKKKLFSEFN
jgi:hypothetical protein